jgi:hypothetical protein
MKKFATGKFRPSAHGSRLMALGLTQGTPCNLGKLLCVRAACPTTICLDLTYFCRRSPSPCGDDEKSLKNTYNFDNTAKHPLHDSASSAVALTSQEWIAEGKPRLADGKSVSQVNGNLLATGSNVLLRPTPALSDSEGPPSAPGSRPMVLGLTQGTPCNLGKLLCVRAACPFAILKSPCRPHHYSNSCQRSGGPTVGTPLRPKWSSAEERAGLLGRNLPQANFTLRPKTND